MPSPREGAGPEIARLVRSQGIADPRVLDAIARVPRERFIPPDVRPLTLGDMPLPIGLDQTISQPIIVATMTLELALTGAERVLEIGTGSGYQSAVLAHLAAEVYTVERHRTLSLRARGILDGLHLTNLHYRVGDGTLGWPTAAPFDRILVTAAAPALPPSLFGQLAEGGILIAPIGDEEWQRMTVVRKVEGKAETREMMSCRFVPLIGEEGWREEG